MHVHFFLGVRSVLMGWLVLGLLLVYVAMCVAVCGALCDAVGKGPFASVTGLFNV